MLKDDSIYRLFKDLPAYIKPVEFNVSPTREDDNYVFSEAMKDVKKLNYSINRVDRKLYVQSIVLRDRKDDNKKLREMLSYKPSGAYGRFYRRHQPFAFP
jgi:hypothetical protein